MKKLLLGFGLSMLFSIAAAPFMPATASAQLPQGASAIETACEETSGWYVNGDETDRKPEVTAAGFKFEATDLMHRALTGVTVDELNEVTFDATPAPNQTSFFSVEVGEPTTYAGYATLRWDIVEDTWIMVRAGVTYKHDDPAELVKLDPAGVRSSNVLSFGVGYTKNPPGVGFTVVKSVTLGDEEYVLVCTPPVEPTPSASASSPAPSSSASSSAAPIAGGTGSLPVTGTRPWVIAGIALAIIAVGILLIWLARRNRVRFNFNLLDD